MSIYSLPQFVSAVLIAVLGGYVLFHNPRSPVNRAYFILAMLTSLWQFFYFIMLNTNDLGFAELMGRIGSFVVIFAPSGYYHFVIASLGKTEQRKRELFVNYLIAAVLAVTVWTGNHMIDGVRKFSFGYYPRGGMPFHPLFVVLTTFNIARATWLAYKAIGEERTLGLRKIQVRYILLAAFTYPVAAIDFLVVYEVQMYPFGVFALIISHAIIAFAMIKHRLLEVKFFARRFSLMILVYCTLIILVSPFLLFLNTQVKNNPQDSLIIICAGVLLLALFISTAPFMFAYFVDRSTYFREHTITGITHELKSPLGVIQSAVEMASDSLQGRAANPKKSLEYIDMIRQNAHRLESFVKALLDVAKIQDEAIQVNKIEFNLSDVVETEAENMRQLMGIKDIRLKKKIEKEILVNADLAKLQQVISNLLSNAIKFSDKGEIEISLHKSEKEIVCSVRDQGRGVNPKDLTKIFDRFYQVNPGTRGSGIGLTIAKAWVEAHGGQIWAESEGAGKGTRVTFSVGAV